MHEKSSWKNEAATCHGPGKPLFIYESLPFVNISVFKNATYDGILIIKLANKPHSKQPFGQPTFNLIAWIIN